MDKFVYNTKGVCASRIAFEIDGDKISKIDFTGGCNGNLKGIKKLLEGSSVKETIEKLKGTTCGSKTTSCPDQVAVGLMEYLEMLIEKVNATQKK